MKTLVFYYHLTPLKECAHLNYEHNQIVDEEPFKVAEKIFSTGLNVMIVHNKNMEASTVVFVDNKMFKQR